MSQEVLDALNRLESRQTAIDARLDDLQKSDSTARNAGLFGSAGPHVRRGEDPLSSRGYSYVKAMAILSRQLPREHGKVEVELSEKLKKNYENMGFQRGMTDSILVPLSSRFLAQAHGDESLAVEVRELVRAGTLGVDKHEVAQLRSDYWGVQKALSWQDELQGGELVGPPQFGELIDLLRNNEVFMQAGARMIAMPPNGRIVWPRQTGAATAYWLGESTAITESNQTTGDVTLQAKKLGVLVKIPNELFRFSSISIEQFVREDIARVVALKLDKTFLDGTGSALEPKGLLNYSGITSHTASTVGANGNTLEPEDVHLMIGKVEEQNAIFKTFIMRPLMYAAMANRRADAVTAADRKGPYLFNMWRTLQEGYIDPTRQSVGNLNGYPVLKSTQVSNTRTKGSATDLSYVLGGDFSDFLIAMSGAMEFAMSQVGDTPFTTDQTWIRGLMHCDGAVRREASFIKCDTLVIA